MDSLVSPKSGYDRVYAAIVEAVEQITNFRNTLTLRDAKQALKASAQFNSVFLCHLCIHPQCDKTHTYQQQVLLNLAEEYYRILRAAARQVDERKLGRMDDIAETVDQMLGFAICSTITSLYRGHCHVPAVANTGMLTKPALRCEYDSDCE